MKYLILMLSLLSSTLYGQGLHPIYTAIKKKDVHEINRILSKPNEIFDILSSRNEQNNTPLFEAALTKDPEILRALMRALKSLPPELIRELLAMKNMNEKTFIHILAQYPELSIFLRQIIDDIYDVNMYDENYSTPLLEAINSGNIEAVQLLLGAGANPDEEDYIDSILTLAIKKGQVNIVREIIEADAPIYVSDIQAAAESGNEQIIQLLIAHAGPNALIMAAEDNFPTIIALFIKYKANLNVENVNGETPLLQAIRNNNEEIITLLLEGGADPLYRTRNNTDAFTEAIRKADIKLLQKLLLYLGPNAYITRIFSGRFVTVGLIEFLFNIHSLVKSEHKTFISDLIQYCIALGFNRYWLLHNANANAVKSILGPIGYAVLHFNKTELETLVKNVDVDNDESDIPLQQGILCALGSDNVEALSILLKINKNIQFVRYLLFVIEQRLHTKDVRKVEKEKLYEMAKIIVEHSGPFLHLIRIMPHELSPLNERLVHSLMKNLGLTDPEYALFIALNIIQQQKSRVSKPREERKRKSDNADSVPKRVHSDLSGEQPSTTYIMIRLRQAAQHLHTSGDIPRALGQEIITFANFLEQNHDAVRSLLEPIDNHGVPLIIGVVRNLEDEINAHSAAAAAETPVESAVRRISRLLQERSTRAPYSGLSFFS